MKMYTRTLWKKIPTIWGKW